MNEIFQSFLMVAITEMGDKTQLLALVLALRYKKPWTIMAGILTATVFNHLLAASVGTWLSTAVSPQILKWALAATFVAFAIWVLIPDKDDDDSKESKYGAFLTTTITFFLAEMGDKTQLSTVALAAKFHSLTLVTMGTTLGMLFSDGLAVFLGEKLTSRIPMRWIHIGASVLYLIFAILILIAG
jgi:putative Ca2+/H+ antiporter (TMEM165/GDT1 family)